MFYRMIENKRNQWYASDDCTVGALIDYIVSAGQMRDAQIDAIKTYLFLKVACDCMPLHELFASGAFNSLDVDALEVTQSVRDYLRSHPAASALYEYATMTNDQGEPVSQKLQEQIKRAPDSIDYEQFFKDAFYGVDYTDYLFSLPKIDGMTILAFGCILAGQLLTNYLLEYAGRTKEEITKLNNAWSVLNRVQAKEAAQNAD